MARVELCPVSEWFFDQRTTSLSATTRHDFSSITIHAPENTSRTFRSVIAVIEARSANSATTSRGSITSWLIGVKLGSASFDDVTVSDTMTSALYDGRYRLTRDVTSYFNTNFGSGTSQTCQIGFQFAQTGANAESMINITCKLYVQYEADLDGQDTRVLTIRLPIESPTGALGNTIAEIGTNQVPALDTLLTNLASKTYRQLTFEAFAAEGNNNTTDYTTEFQLDNESPVADGNHECGPMYNCSWVRHWRRDDMTTNATHAFKARATKTSTTEKLCVFLVVTLTYSRTSSTKDFVSLKMPFQLTYALGATATSGDLSRATVQFPVPEANPSLKQSGVFIGIYCTGFESIGTLSVKCGGQSARGYTTMGDAGNDTGNTGIASVLQRIDSGGAQGAGITLSQGDNELTIDAYASIATNTFPGFISGYAVVNYECDKLDGGNRTCVHMIAATAADSAARQVTTAPAIPESSYRLFSVGVESNIRTFGSIGRPIVTLQLEYESGDTPSAGWWSSTQYGENTSNTSIYNLLMWWDPTAAFKRWPGDRRGGMDVETTRKWMLLNMIQAPAWVDAFVWFSYSSKTYTVAGTATGFSDTLTIGLHRASTGEKVAETTREDDGSYSFSVYDNANEYFVQIEDENGVCGRSQSDVAA